ncbi:metallophosphoesterase [Flavobacterium columnare]|uniref:Metallophosphoesterase n=1 Tax=Flavobacterium columnare TaxID=996 RepID=A0AAI8GB11_9FLAO|nr:metallophosphoesterase [Flavobacterium columnare]AMO20108.1 metallophosphoesterase [Flavobacterium columnare]AUX18057.1 phosphoesterase [Flavobacterium columnare]QOG57124.1 metallophosphoesterase [Flavobacterium columnare]QOG59848.1 metallophosphoesterase [Flavobacterium columnare]QOG62568.1 metallophosphoesterase [Flavobacterium columnare]
MLFRFIVIAILLFLIEIYSLQAFKTLVRSKWIFWIGVAISMLIYIFIFYTIFNFDRKVGQTKQSLFALGLLLTVYLPKIVLTLFMFGEDVFRFLSGVANYFIEYDNRSTFLPERRKFISQVALGLAAIPFLSLIYGVTKGKYNFKVFKQDLFFDDLPETFDGFTITHISDIHSGSFDDPEKIQYAIDLINEQNSDILLFTGDIVNAKAEEMTPWISVFKSIKEHRFGKFSVLGNHDYGAYIEWESEQAKIQNFEAIKNLHQQIDFKLLLNEHTKIRKDGAELALVGVENWGKHFGMMGDIDKASEGLTNKDFKILMSHDPSHWEEVVKQHDKKFHLTLSGHTHGMQFGIEIPGYFKWSLAQYMYKQWAGCYEYLGRYIYVNRGFGFHAYPGRVGIMPEITVIRLKKA